MKTKENSKRSNMINWIDVGKKNIELVCKRNSLPEKIAKLAYDILNSLDVYERNSYPAAIAAVYLACKKKGQLRTLEELEERTFILDPRISQEFLLELRKKRLGRTKKNIEKIQSKMEQETE
jgi:transcription initiation factor TFIIIB Brf1 subunit/transcription initiation factor TFIIB